MKKDDKIFPDKIYLTSSYGTKSWVERRVSVFDACYVKIADDDPNHNLNDRLLEEKIREAVQIMVNNNDSI